MDKIKQLFGSLEERLKEIKRLKKNKISNEDRLEEIYHYDKWYFARHKAAKALKLHDETIDRKLNYWISSLEYEHNWRVVEKQSEQEEEKKDWLPKKAKKDLKKFYNSRFLDSKHVAEAGKHLGYSQARIWTRIHQVDFALVASGVAFLYTIYHVAKEVFS